MNGVGPYNDWAYYSSASSNLSAFATPFSVNRFNSMGVHPPLTNSAESADSVPPVHFPAHSHTYGYDFFPNPVKELESTASTKPYGYLDLEVVDSSGTHLPHFNFNSLGLASKEAFAYDQYPNSTKSSVFESQPYYPSYISPPIHHSTSSVSANHWYSSSGFATLDGSSSVGDYGKKPAEMFSGQRDVFWNQSAEFNQGLSKQVEGGSSLCSKQTNITGSVVEESIVNQGCQDVMNSNSGESLHMIGWKKHSGSLTEDPLDDKFCWWETIKSTPVVFSNTYTVGTPSVSLETHHETPLKFVADSGNHHSSYAGSFEKHLTQRDQPSWVDTGSSMPQTGLVEDLNVDNILVEDLNVGNIASDGVHGSNNIYDMKEAVAVPSPGTATAGCFDLGQLHMHLSHEPTSLNNTLISDKSVPNDVLDYLFKDKSESQNLHTGQENLSLRLSVNEGFNSVEKSFDNADRYNSAVDSPCWKGVPSSHFPHYEAFEVMAPGYQHKNEECFGSIIQGSQKFLLDRGNNVKKSCEISNNNQMHKESDYQEQSFTGSSSNFSVTKITAEDCDSDGAVNDGQFQSEPNCDCGLQYLDGTRKNSVPPTKPIYDCETRSSSTEHQVLEENKLISQKQLTVCDGGPDAGCNLNECLEYDASPTAKGDLSSPALVVVAPTTVEKSAEKASTQKLNVQMLVDMMHNLSELLLFHCLNGACELKEQECIVLRKVISNLNTCAIKNADQTAPAQDCLLPQLETSRFSGETCEIQKNASFERPQLTTVVSESSNAELKLENPLFQDAKNLHFRSGKPHWSFSDSFAPRVDEEIKEDSMTKAIKDILSVNSQDQEGAESQTTLYKNLWLEAEAALCSIYYKARYNQMKIDMKFAFEQKDNALDMAEKSKHKVAPSLSTSESFATKMQSGLTPDSSVLDLPVLNATDLKDVSTLKFATDLNKTGSWTREGKGSHELDISIQNSINSGTNKEAGDDEAYVMTRFNVLKARFDKSCISTVLEELSSKEDSLASNGRDHQSPVDLPILSKANDYKASAMAKFHILKSRDEDSSFISLEGQPLDGSKFDGKGIDFSATNDASKGESMDVFLNLSSYPTIDKSSTKVFNVDLEDNQEEIQPSRTYMFGNYGHQLPTYYSDGLAFDWEHIGKKTL